MFDFGLIAVVLLLLFFAPLFPGNIRTCLSGSCGLCFLVPVCDGVSRYYIII